DRSAHGNREGGRDEARRRGGIRPNAGDRNRGKRNEHQGETRRPCQGRIQFGGPAVGNRGARRRPEGSRRGPRETRRGGEPHRERHRQTEGGNRPAREGSEGRERPGQCRNSGRRRCAEGDGSLETATAEFEARTKALDQREKKLRDEAAAMARERTETKAIWKNLEAERERVSRKEETVESLVARTLTKEREALVGEREKVRAAA